MLQFILNQIDKLLVNISHTSSSLYDSFVTNTDICSDISYSSLFKNSPPPLYLGVVLVKLGTTLQKPTKSLDSTKTVKDM